MISGSPGGQIGTIRFDPTGDGMWPAGMNVHAAFGLYAPNAYPFRNMTKVNGKTYTFNSDFADPPPPTLPPLTPPAAK
jgi:hypothetical protein